MKIFSYADYLKEVSFNNLSLQYVPLEYRTSELCLAGVSRCGLALQFVSEKLKTLELCLVAVKQTGCALRFVPEYLKTPEMCLEAIRWDQAGLIYISEIFLRRNRYLTSWRTLEKLSLSELTDLFLTDQEFLAKYSLEELLTSPYVYLRELGKKGVKNDIYA